MEEIENQPINHKRKPFIAFLLSIWTPGLGQLYNGQFKKGMVLFGLMLFVYLAFIVFNVGVSFYMYVAMLLLVIISRVYGIIDAVVWSFRLKQYTLKKYNTTVFYLAYAIIGTALPALMIYGGLSGTQLYHIPTTGCSPTVDVGDYVILNKRAYNNADIKCGDIVGYYSISGEVYLCRVIGLPGDTLSVNDDIVTINGKQSQSTFIKNTKTADKFKVAEYSETLPNGVKHSIYKSVDPLIGPGFKSDTTNIVVQANSYFLMGDNRDGSLDSRYQGAVSRERIIGQIMYVLYRKGDKKKGAQFNIDLTN